MPTDLWYFHESVLNKGDLTTFYYTLPDHLREMFTESRKSYEICDKNDNNVLQGYRGPYNNGSSGDSQNLSAIDGLQEVKYWWGVTKHLNWIPIAGNFVFAYTRAIQDTNWYSLYFDSKTEECLSHDKEVAAHKLNETGRKLYDSGKFAEAKEYFSNAYTHSNEKVNYDVYKENENKAQAAIDKNKQADLLDKEGNELHQQGKYEEAYAKFEQACNKCTSGYSEEARFKSNKDVAKNNWAGEINKQGNQFWERKDYSRALEMYNLAYNKCTSGYKNEQIFKNNRDKAQTEIDAIGLKELGDREFEGKRYDSAKVKYQQAYDKSSVSSNKNTYNTCINKAKAELDAIGLKELGDREFEGGRYDSAKAKYQQAYFNSSVSSNENTYNTCINKAKAELDAIGLKELGDREFEGGRYDSAKAKYQQAYFKSSVSSNENTYNTCINKAKAELDAIGLKELGDREFEGGRYDSAKAKYQQAYDKSSVSSNKNTYNTCINKAKAELDAIGLKELGDREFEAGRYDSAKAKYQQAYDKSSVSSNKNTYNTCINKAKAELDAIGLKELGDREFEGGRYDSAKAKYQQAYDKSSVSSNKNTYNTCINKAKAELDAIGLKELGDREFEGGRYDSAKAKYQQAYDKSSVSSRRNSFATCIKKAHDELNAGCLKELGDEEFNKCRYRDAYKIYQDAYNMSSVDNNKEAYNTCIVKTKTELDAVNLKQQADEDLGAGRYDSAQVKYQQAYEKSSVSSNKYSYKACIIETKTKARSSILTEFNLTIKQDSSEEKLTNLGIRLEKMIDEGCGSDREIVSRLHVISLRLARNKMKSQSVDQDHMSDLIEAIMNLLETEIGVLKILNITDERLEHELKSLEERLDALDPDIADEEDENDDMLVNIATIAFRADEIFEQIEDMALERLGQTEQVLA